MRAVNAVRVFFFVFVFLWVNLVFAAKKATVIGNEVEIYSEADFDSEIIDEVRAGETYPVSNKPVGAFYRIKLKSGKIGYIVDYELDIEGIGPLKPKEFDDVFMEDSGDEQTKEQLENETDTDSLSKNYSGLLLQMINYQENVLGGVQADNLTTIGYKSVSYITWSLAGSFTPPKYYAAKTGGSVSGINWWADLGYSNTIGHINKSDLRFSGSVFLHSSNLRLVTAQKTYNIDDASVGVALEGSIFFKFKKLALDLSLKYYVDKVSYAALGMAVLF